jgi:SAM-dependent methyltransferase
LFRYISCFSSKRMLDNELEKYNAPLLEKGQTEVQLLGSADRTQAALVPEGKPPPNPRLERRNYWLLIFGTVTLKFTWETLHGAFTLFGLERLNNLDLYALLIILYAFSASIGSVAVNQIISRFRASRVMAVLLVITALLIATIIILEASTGGTLEKPGTWSPFIIYPIGIGLGMMEGMVEVTRRVIAPLIVDDEEDEAKLKRVNSSIHIAFGLAGTAGAFSTTPLIDFFGFVYALSHLPVILAVGAILFSLIHHRMPSKQETPEDKLTKYSGNPVKQFLRNILNRIKNYLLSLKEGGKLILSSNYWWLLLTFTLPQVLYFLTDMLLMPFYADHVLNEDSLVGVFLGSINFGEFIGALTVFLVGTRVKNIFLWTRIYAALLNVYWFFPFVKMEEPLYFALAMIGPLVFLNAGFSSNDVSMLSYIQCSFPEDELENESTKRKPKELQKLASVIGFLYTMYAILASLSAVGTGRLFYYYKDTLGSPRGGFVWIPALAASVLSGSLLLLTLFVKIVPPSGGFKIVPD